MGFSRVIRICAASMAVVGIASAHNSEKAHQKPLQVAPDADWGTRHMAEEHHISNFDAGAFFTLHDFDGNGFWDTSEILKTYGMDDPSAKDVPQAKKDQLVHEILRLMDRNANGVLERDELLWYCEELGGKMPDFGLGPGHHWDMETEYEIHHWEKYHDENTTEADLTHPEDIEHFKKHDELEDEAAKQAAMDRQPIVEQNIPLKFRRE